MSAENSITPGARDVEQDVAATGFQMPPELASRYELRVIDGADGEQRLGLFRSTDRENPSVEITNDRIVARSEDPETVAALVAIAQHSGWDRIAVDGSPEFRKAVWEAASREGLIVSGYDPSFAEQERVAGARKSADEQRRRDTQEPAQPVEKVDAATIDPGSSAASPTNQADQGSALGDDGQGLSEGDRRLLLTLSRHTEDRKGLYERFDWDMDEFAREVHFERLDLNQEALATALERALESPTLVKALEGSGYEPDALRRSGSAKEWDGEVANAIYLVRSGLHRDTLERGGEAQTLAQGSRLDREEPPSSGRETRTQDQLGEHEASGGNPPSRAAADRRRESEELAELFLHGNPERIAAEPRLAQALQAQATMEQHIVEVFGADQTERASATLESRQMISDALRRGLDVAVRERTPVRQLEPAHARPDLER